VRARTPWVRSKARAHPGSVAWVTSANVVAEPTWAHSGWDLVLEGRLASVGANANGLRFSVGDRALSDWLRDVPRGFESRAADVRGKSVRACARAMATFGGGLGLAQSERSRALRLPARHDRLSAGVSCGFAALARARQSDGSGARGQPERGVGRAHGAVADRFESRRVRRGGEGGCQRCARHRVRQGRAERRGCGGRRGELERRLADAGSALATWQLPLERGLQSRRDLRRQELYAAVRHARRIDPGRIGGRLGLRETRPVTRGPEIRSTK